MVTVRTTSIITDREETKSGYPPLVLPEFDMGSKAVVNHSIPSLLKEVPDFRLPSKALDTEVRPVVGATVVEGSVIIQIAAPASVNHVWLKFSTIF